MKRDYKQWIRPEILQQSAYAVADAAGFIKLDAMENPYPLPEALWADLAQSMQKVEINRYPSADGTSVKDSLRETMGIPMGMDILLGNGSDELIQIIALAMARPGAKMLSVGPTFSVYHMVATFFGMTYLSVDLKPDFSLDLEKMLETIEGEQPALIFLAYPNNPTGILYEASAVEAIIRAAPGIVVVDEAYHAFAQKSFLGRLGEFDNLLVMRTLSKLGLAGARFGFLCGPSDWLKEFDKVRLPYNVNSMTQQVVETVLPRIDLFEEQAADMVADRDRLYEALLSLNGLKVYPSDANFLLFKVNDAPKTFNGLLNRGVLIKSLHGVHPLLENCLRVSMGTPTENAAFLAVLEETLNELS